VASYPKDFVISDRQTTAGEYVTTWTPVNPVRANNLEQVLIMRTPVNGEGWVVHESKAESTGLFVPDPRHDWQPPRDKDLELEWEVLNHAAGEGAHGFPISRAAIRGKKVFLGWLVKQTGEKDRLIYVPDPREQWKPRGNTVTWEKVNASGSYTPVLAIAKLDCLGFLARENVLPLKFNDAFFVPDQTGNWNPV